MKKILEAVCTVTIISTITRLIAFAFKVYLSRTLGAEVLGVYQITMSIFVLLMALPASGLPTALSRHIASLEAVKDNNNSRGILTSALIISSGISLIMICICYMFPNITSLLFTDKRCARMFFIMLPALFSASVYCIIRSYFWGVQNYLIYAGSELIEEVLSVIIVIVTIAFGIFGDNLSDNIAYAFLISDYVATFLLVVAFFVKGGKFARPTMLKPLTHSAIPMTSTRILGSLVSSMMALLIPLLLVSAGASNSEATASYGRASGMVMPLIFVPSTLVGSLAVVVIPNLASMNVKGGNIKRTISSAITFTMVVSCLFLAIYIAIGDRLCTFLYKDSIAGSYMIIASFVMIPMSLNQMVVSLLNTLGHENTTFKVHIIGSIILTSLIFILPKYIGIYAYFVVLLVFHIVTNCIYIFTLNKAIKLDNMLLKNSFFILIFALSIGFALKTLTLYINNNVLSIMIASILIGISYLIFVTRMGYIDINLLNAKFRKKQ